MIENDTISQQTAARLVIIEVCIKSIASLVLQDLQLGRPADRTAFNPPRSLHHTVQADGECHIVIIPNHAVHARDKPCATPSFRVAGNPTELGKLCHHCPHLRIRLGDIALSKDHPLGIIIANRALYLIRAKRRLRINRQIAPVLVSRVHKEQVDHLIRYGTRIAGQVHRLATGRELDGHLTILANSQRKGSRNSGDMTPDAEYIGFFK